ncbi:hypothetical protein M8818_006608 [Zalaria obscura]|uniref:Uncharacterized protein n=1 Tax=Zalaria obscura TaxID=2024903 RepID=A0ACC3S9D8_9PEZI
MDAVSIQEANKIRAALGMAPLPVPGEASGLSFKDSKDEGSDSDESDHVSTLEKRQAFAGENWKRHEEEQKAKEERIARKEAAKKARDTAQRFAKLEGKGLGDADDVELDTKTWLLQQKKRQKKIEQARKYEEEQLVREQQAQYTAKDLAGVKVGHELDQFADGGEQVLTLKDTVIGEEDEEDELENLDLRAQEKLNEKLELKKKKPVYNPMDDDSQKGILSQYDEEIEGKKNGAFTLDGRGSTIQAQAAARREADLGAKGIKINLDMFKDETPVSDYMEASASTKIRKPKKNKAKTTRQKAVDEDDIFPIEPPAAQTPKPDDSAMDVDGAQPAGGNARKRVLEFDDDDLQAKLAEQRRQALKKRKKTDAAELARQIREEASATPAAQEAEDEEEPGMVIDETTEFVSNLQRPTAPEERRTATPANAGGAALSPSPEPDQDGDTDMKQSYADVEDEEDLKARQKRESETPAAITATGFEEEDTIDNGIGASLSMLRKRGLISDSAASEQNERDRQREQFLAENRALIAEYDAKSKEQRERDRKSGNFDRMSARERENYARQQNEQREAFLARLQAEHFRKSYKPDVKLRYNDEFGREMNQKEAFKHLSHMFHGKGSGKQKTEKRLKKIEDERKREAMSSLDASQHTGMNSAMGATARKNRQAGVRLQ